MGVAVDIPAVIAENDCGPTTLHAQALPPRTELMITCTLVVIGGDWGNFGAAHFAAQPTMLRRFACSLRLPRRYPLCVPLFNASYVPRLVCARFSSVSVAAMASEATSASAAAPAEETKLRELYPENDPYDDGTSPPAAMYALAGSGLTFCDVALCPQGI